MLIFEDKKETGGGGSQSDFYRAKQVLWVDIGAELYHMYAAMLAPGKPIHRPGDLKPSSLDCQHCEEKRESRQDFKSSDW